MCHMTKGDIPLWGKYIPKIINFCDFGGCKPTNFKATALKLDLKLEGANLGDLPQAKFCKVA